MEDVAMEDVSSGGVDVSVVPTVAQVYDQAVALCRPDAVLIPTATTVEAVADMVQQLRDTSDCSRYLQGGLLWRLRQNNLWRTARPELSWPEFCTNVVGLSYRMVSYLVSMYERVIELGLTPERLAQIGWTKAREFLAIATKDDIESWIQKAQVMSTAELKKQIEDARVTGEATAEVVATPMARLTVFVESDEKDLVESAIDFAQRLRSTESVIVSRGTALAYIALEWQANHIADPAQALEWHLRNLERVYRVTLVVSDAGVGGGTGNDA